MTAERFGRLNRRAFLAAGGSIVVSFSLPSLGAAGLKNQDGPDARKPRALKGSLSHTPLLDSWIRIDADGGITVFTGKVELGQGIKTALIQVAGEGLLVDPARIQLITADTARTPDERYTAGSQSMQDSATAILNAAAQVREILIGIAARRFDVDAATLTVEDGIVRSGRGRTISYADLAKGADLRVRARPDSPLLERVQRAYMGKSFPRVDIPIKLTGRAIYVQDLRLEDMLHGRVVRPPSYGARLESADLERIGTLSGVVSTVRNGSFLAVLARREYEAVVAARELAGSARWSEHETLPEQAKFFPHLLGLRSQDIPIADGNGVSKAAGSVIEAHYLRQYQIHGSIGPSCAVALLRDDKLTVWTHSQGVYPLQRAIAEMVALPPAKVRCIHMEGSGCYGHNGADDAAADAALLAMSIPGRPVRVQWMRQDEHRWEPYGAAMVTSAKARLTANGMVEEFQFHVWSNSHNERPGPAGNLLPALHLERPFAKPAPKPAPQPNGGGDRNAIPLYRFGNMRVVNHFIPEMPLRVSALRALGAYMNIFSLESFVDEMAQAARVDAVEFRLKHLDDERARDVVQEVAKRFDWSGYRRQASRGRGFAFARYKNHAAYLAIACEVEVQRESGRMRMVRAVAAVDSGEAVNPDGMRNQIEGGIIQSMSWSLFEAVSYDRTRITSADWSTYPILRFADVPDRIEVHVISRSGEPFLGTGEAAQGPTAAALGNALADASGVRLRELPMTRAHVKRALGV